MYMNILRGIIVFPVRQVIFNKKRDDTNTHEQLIIIRIIQHFFSLNFFFNDLIYNSRKSKSN
jgi:hypothetical protein